MMQRIKRLLNAFVCFSFLLLVLSTGIPRAHSAPTTSNPKIVIIGAGPSGISAAVKLLEHGFEDVTILEAESRIGGRIHTIPFGDNVVDMGAQWCHGEKNNVVYELMKGLDMFGTTAPMYKNISFIRSSGENMEKDVMLSIINLLDEIKMKRGNDSIPVEVTSHDFMMKELNSALGQPEYQNIDKEIALELLKCYEYEECSLESSDNVTILSARGNKEYEECEGDQSLTWKDKGFKTLLNFLMKTEEIGKEYGLLNNHIRFSKKVKNINWKRDDTKVLITCEDDEDILADHVIVTVSLGVLKSNHGTLFTPALDEKKRAAIEKIGFGSVGKIFLEFDKKFWPDYWTGFTILWSKDDLKDLRGTDRFWWEGFAGFYAVDYQPRVLEGWMIGPSSRFMETLSEEDVRDSCLKIFKRLLKWDIPESFKMNRTTWYTNPNFKGTYSYHSIDTLKSGVSPRDLEEVLSVPLVECGKNDVDTENRCEKPIVQFAGEATSIHHYSTVHGAVETGWREANRLEKFYGVEK